MHLGEFFLAQFFVQLGDFLAQFGADSAVLFFGCFDAAIGQI